MSLFFDAEWFGAKLAAHGLDRTALALAARLERRDLHLVFTNERAATAAELATFAEVLDAGIVEVTLRAGIATRAPPRPDDPTARIDDIEARLDAIDSWLAQFESRKQRA